jgi:hypothetical protein
MTPPGPAQPGGQDSSVPYKDRDKQNAYCLEWMARRRSEWFAQHGPCSSCGSREHLEVHHRDRSTKVDHKVWSWSKERRDAELAKCVVLCRPCHGEASVQEGSRMAATHGTRSRYEDAGCRCELCRERHLARIRYRNLRRSLRQKGIDITNREEELRLRAGFPHMIINGKLLLGCRLERTSV